MILHCCSRAIFFSMVILFLVCIYLTINEWGWVSYEELWKREISIIFIILSTCLFLAFTCRFAIHTVLDIANFFQLLSALSRCKDFLRGLNQSKTEISFSKGIWLIFPKKYKISPILYCRIKKLKTKTVLPYQTRSILIIQIKEGKVRSSHDFRNIKYFQS